ncbi:hypothetical protein EJ02DRAFT_510266 [Clathrospora elynae]|uniref:Uncharacterized protein n=1 Tax=Clathrospora elynae TaxID=706981 RepID=A0A6A5SYA0_9PLEO|nr:hypothetical protein EJ02DRAFT_510266 [Clathrospora elynae]
MFPERFLYPESSLKASWVNRQEVEKGLAMLISAGRTRTVTRSDQTEADEVPKHIFNMRYANFAADPVKYKWTELEAWLLRWHRVGIFISGKETTDCHPVPDSPPLSKRVANVTDKGDRKAKRMVSSEYFLDKTTADRPRASQLARTERNVCITGRIPIHLKAKLKASFATSWPVKQPTPATPLPFPLPACLPSRFPRSDREHFLVRQVSKASSPSTRVSSRVLPPMQVVLSREFQGVPECQTVWVGRLRRMEAVHVRRGAALGASAPTFVPGGVVHVTTSDVIEKAKPIRAVGKGTVASAKSDPCDMQLVLYMEAVGA